jgi:predicted TIM-barrel fold metal-dependent hydrolase
LPNALKEGFCAPDPDRLIGIFQMPSVGIETSVAELERAKREGFRGVALSSWPSGGDDLRAEDGPVLGRGRPARHAGEHPHPPRRPAMKSARTRWPRRTIPRSAAIFARVKARASARGTTR